MLLCRLRGFIYSRFSSKAAFKQHKRLSHRLLALTVLLSFSFTTTLQANVPGVTPGEFSVDASGSANYQMPIAVPPGSAGMQPSLSLAYNSNTGNGLMGVGFV